MPVRAADIAALVENGPPALTAAWDNGGFQVGIPIRGWIESWLPWMWTAPPLLPPGKRGPKWWLPTTP